ncbi:ATPase, partial [Vibrio parahaemolyticus]|nr:ATPase [Vibrio parahaemolyticus]
MKNMTSLSLTAGSLNALLAIGMRSNSLANNKGFP